eukprot:NODE_758_length_4503_cov_0.443460.p2 type:complete len:215 gc:universal NODE_758_length_4503_cov_0.443460:814-1458(+)
MRILKPNRIQYFPILPYIAVIILWIAVLGFTWERTSYTSISVISSASYGVELVWLLILGIFLIKLFKLQDYKEYLFSTSCVTIGLTLILMLCWCGLFPIYSTETSKKSSVVGFVAFLRVALYIDYLIHLVLYLGLYIAYIKQNKILWLCCTFAIFLIILGGGLYSVFPIHELLHFSITLWLMITIVHAFIITDYKDYKRFAIRARIESDGDINV